MDKKEAMKQFAALGQSWYGNSKQHAAFAAYDRYNGYNKLADKKSLKLTKLLHKK